MRPWAMCLILVAATVWLVLTMGTALAQAAVDLQFGPDPAAINLNSADLPGWSLKSSRRELLTVAHASPVHGATHVFAPEPAPDEFEALTSIVSVFPSADEASAAYRKFASGAQRTPIDVSGLAADEAVAWWFPPGGRGVQGMLFARVNNVELVLRLVVPIDQRPEQLLTGPAATLVARVRAADPAPPDFDWDQVLPGNPRPWDALPQSEELGPPWSATFVRVWPEAGGGAPFEPILDGQASFTDGKDSTVMVSVSLFDSAESAISRVAMPRRPNARPLTLPARGDQSSGTTETFSTGPTAQTSYVVSIRRGSWMVGVAVGGPSASVPPADFAINLAIRADERLAAALDQS